MKSSGNFFVRTLITGLLVIVPIYLAILMLLKVLQSLAGLMKPIAALLPEALPAEGILALLMLLVVSFLAGLAALSPAGRRLIKNLETRILFRIPGYQVFHQITQRVAGNNDGGDWQPALIEIEDALVPGFVVEELKDGRLTVFVPSVPTPLAGAVYILTADRVHRLDVPFAQAIKTVTRWGAGSKDLIAAMDARTIK
jgi:uncharacterized membrane protein